MLHTNTPWNLVAEGYAVTTSKLFEGYAHKALALTKISSKSHVLDVACGPGTLTLSAQSLCQSIEAIDFSQNMVDVLEASIANQHLKNINVICGDGQQLPYQDSVFDAAFSMFGLMFFPNRQKGYEEIYRTLKPGGEVVISSWAPIADSPAMQLAYGAMQAMNPEMPDPKAEIQSLENNTFFKQELESAGFKDVTIHRVTEVYPIESIEAYWHSMVIGGAPIAMMKASMSRAEWLEKEKLALDYLSKALPETPTSRECDAWLGYGVKA